MEKINIILIVTSLATFIGGVTAILKAYKSITQPFKAATAGIKALLYFRICRESSRITKRKFATLHEIEDISEIYGVYSEMGGNGAAKKLYEAACNVEIVSDEECERRKIEQCRDLFEKTKEVQNED
jgi:hypothetical protein